MSYHVPVLLTETIHALEIRPDGIYVDATMGGGGHLQQILNHLDSRGTAVGIDRDPRALEQVARTVVSQSAHLITEQCRFSQIDTALDRHGIEKVDGILADLGVSSHQIDDPSRGFSYSRPDSALDMRMGPDAPAGAAELLATSGVEQLEDILRNYGEIQNPRRMARLLAAHAGELTDSATMRRCLESEYGPNLSPKMLSKLYQALRIAVNGELDELKMFLGRAAGLLKTGGRLVVIAYHSLEDRLVKNAFRDGEGRCVCPPSAPVCTCNPVATLKRINKKVIEASAQEIALNPRARSARMRVAQRLAAA